MCQMHAVGLHLLIYRCITTSVAAKRLTAEAAVTELVIYGSSHCLPHNRIAEQTDTRV